MKNKLKILVAIAALVGALLGGHKGASAAEKRIALVVGNANYPTKPLETTANDAGLIAQTLQAAGFDVTGARDLDEDSLRHAFRDFVDKAAAEGPDTVAFVYFAGYGLQLEGENYLLPVGADIRRDADIPSKATRVSDYIRSLAASGLKAGVVVLDAARANPLALSGAPLASGLALYEPGPHMLLALNAAPGTIAPQEKGPYGAYAHALSEMIRDGGLSLTDVFDRVRLRVDETARGAQMPWNSPRFDSSFVFFERSAEAPAQPDRTASARTKPIGELGPRDGYAAAVERDTMQGYQDFVAFYPSDPSAKRIRAIMAVRREAITWRRTRIADTPNAYWSYLRRYPRGPHVADARRRLAELAAAYDPPPSFEMIDYDVPPPPEEEIVYVDRPVFIFDDPDFGFAPPPPPPVYFLPPPPPDFVVLPPPVVIEESYALPMPVFVPIPVWQHPPAYVASPPNNLIFEHYHDRVFFDHDKVVIKDSRDQILSSTVLKAAVLGGVVGGIGATLPRILSKKTPPDAIPTALPQGAGGAQPPGTPPPGQQGQGGAQQPPIPTGAAPTANLHTPPTAQQPLPTQGTLPPGGGTSGKPASGQAPAGASGAAPTANLHALPTAQPLPTPEKPPLAQGGQGKPAKGRAPPAGAGANPAATPQAPSNAKLDQPPPQTHRATDHAPAMNPPSQPGGQFLGNRARDMTPALREQTQSPPAAVHRQPPPPVVHAPPPAAVYRQPPPQVVHAPPPAAVYRQPPPQVVHAPPPAFHPPAAPAAAAMRAPPPAPHGPAPQAARQAPPAKEKHCEIVNGAQVCK